MLKPPEILESARRKWPAALRAEANGETLFPLRIPFGRPSTTGDYSILRHEIDLLARASHEWYIDWEEIQTRKWGRQRWPTRVIFKSIDDMACALGLRAELHAFRNALQTAREMCPKLDPWLRTKAHRIPDYLPIWAALVSVCAYFDSHPRPQCYSRQIPLPVGTKFIEENYGVLRELLECVLGDRINAGGVTFAERFHLLIEPPQVRFRFLDESLRKNVGWPVSDCSIPAPVFSNLAWRFQRVIVVENRDVFLCLPEVPRTLAIFGSGKAASLLPSCEWMDSADIVYWGDCDEAGYGILSALRSHFSQVRSLLMDEVSWRDWKHLAVEGKRDSSARHFHLTSSEQAALKAVLEGPYMLEQERIPADEAERAILKAFLGSRSQTAGT
jgi:hypothetical protein